MYECTIPYSVSEPLNNGERYPPIPLPPPPPSANVKPNENFGPGVNCGPLLETGQILIHNSNVVVVQENNLEAKNIVFNDQTIRKGFIRKVYFILLVSKCRIFCTKIYFTYHFHIVGTVTFYLWRNDHLHVP